MPSSASRPRTPSFEVRTSPIAGLGVFAARRIRKGTRIIEYVGRRITSAEADALYDDDSMAQHHTVLFAVDDDTVIDAAVDGNEARFINHACAPNCEAVNEDGRIFIEALADIAPGVELVYDYSLARDEPWDESWRKLYACHCGAPDCRGIILKSPTPPKLGGAPKPPAEKKRTRAPAKKGAKSAPKKAKKAPVSAGGGRRSGGGRAAR